MSSSDGSAHAMIVYGVKGDELEVADPNFPGDTKRRVRFNNATGEFEPYYSGSRSDAAEVPFTEIFYLGLTSLVDWNTPASRWKEFDQGTIGKGIFPEYSLHVQNEDVEYVPLTDGFKLPEGRLAISVRAPAFSETFGLYGQRLEKLGVDRAVTLTGGRQYIGVHVMNDDFKWVGFKWVLVEAPGGNPTSKDGPASGPLYGTLSIDGEPVSVATARFEAGLGARRLFVVNAYPSFLSSLYAFAESFEGEGEYSVLNDGLDSPRWTDERGFIYFVQNTSPGRLRITKWRNDTLEGNLTFKGFSGLDGSTRDISYTFRNRP